LADLHAGGGQLVSQVFLQAHDGVVLQVDLDRDEQRLPDLQDRHPIHH